MMGRLAVVVAACLSASPAFAADAISCILRPVHMLKVATPVSGLVAQFHVDRGDTVEAGQLLAQINTTVEETQFRANQRRAESEASLNVWRAQAQDAERRLAQAQSLFDRGVATQSQLDDAIAGLELARSQVIEAEETRELLLLDLAAARAALELRQIMAPVSGVVLARHVNVGEFATSDRPLLDLVSVRELHAEVLFPAAQFGSFALGDDLAILDELAQIQRAGVINAIDPIIDAASNSFGLRVLIDNDDLALAAGARCRVVP